MADITFRLPGREQYSYAEVTFTSEEYTEPGPYPVADLLKQALDDLNATFPQAAGQSSAGASQAPVASQHVGGQQAPSCVHGQRILKNGTSARGAWSAWMCPNRDRNTACKPVDAVTGKSW